MGENLTTMAADATKLKGVLMYGNNIGILLYLAKYNPKVSKKDIADRFGKDSVNGLKALEQCELVKEDDGNLTLTTQGIFQVEGLLTMAVT
ncbi:MAG: hypothetical protein AABW99_01530 [archaeon]